MERLQFTDKFKREASRLSSRCNGALNRSMFREG
jgi:hypothetical protein